MGKFVKGYNRLPDSRNIWMIQANEEGEAEWNWDEFFGAKGRAREQQRIDWGDPDSIKSTTSRKRIQEEFCEGDLVFCYQAAPQCEIVGLTRISSVSPKALRFDLDRWGMRLKDDLPFGRIKKDPLLCHMEKVKSPQGTVLRVSKDEAQRLLELLRLSDEQRREVEEKWRFPDDTTAPTADPIVLEERVRQILSKGPVTRPPGQPVPQRQSVGPSTVYKRDPRVKAYVLAEAKGHCELCRRPAPFLNDKKERFLEVHHVLRLVHGGPDTVENTVAVCPNCHRSLHMAIDATARERKLYATIQRLKPSSSCSIPGN